MENISHIFGSASRVKIMRLFLFNTKTPYDSEEVSSRSKVAKSIARRELHGLEQIGFLQKKTYVKSLVIKSKNKNRPDTIKKKKTSGWLLNVKFPLLEPLRKLLIESQLVSIKEFPNRFSGAGVIKLMMLSGVFLYDDMRLIDLLIVGNKLNKRMIEKAIGHLEAEVGKEIRYAFFEEAEFMYRMNMYDKLLRDIFDYPHKKLVNRLDLNL